MAPRLRPRTEVPPADLRRTVRCAVQTADLGDSEALDTISFMYDEDVPQPSLSVPVRLSEAATPGPSIFCTTPTVAHAPLLEQLCSPLDRWDAHGVYDPLDDWRPDELAGPPGPATARYLHGRIVPDDRHETPAPSPSLGPRCAPSSSRPDQALPVQLPRPPPARNRSPVGGTCCLCASEFGVLQITLWRPWWIGHEEQETIPGRSSGAPERPTDIRHAEAGGLGIEGRVCDKELSDGRNCAADHPHSQGK